MIDKILAWLKDGHVPVSVFIFIVGTALQWFHHLDPTFVAYTGTVLTAITGHAYFNRGKDDDSGK